MSLKPVSKRSRRIKVGKVKAKTNTISRAHKTLVRAIKIQPSIPGLDWAKAVTSAKKSPSRKRKSK